MNDRPHCLNVLLACMDRLREKHLVWARLARSHHDDMVSGRFSEMERGVAQLENQLLDIGDEEELRLRTTLELADTCGLSDDPPPRLTEIAAQLPAEWSAELVSVGQKLREAVAVAEEIGRRSAEIARIGLAVSQGAIKMAQDKAVKASRQPAAYARGGQRTTGTAVPVYQRVWKA